LGEVLAGNLVDLLEGFDQDVGDGVDLDRGGSTALISGYRLIEIILLIIFKTLSCN
jgi:hypothetical protein